MSRARRALAVAIADFVDGTQDFCRERVSEIDRDLQKRDAYTLSFLREQFTRDVIGYNQSMKPTAPDRNESGVFVTTSWRDFSLFR